ncbi:Isoleucine--tRNA ligase [Bienertia sinuspersici]
MLKPSQITNLSDCLTNHKSSRLNHSSLIHPFHEVIGANSLNSLTISERRAGGATGHGEPAGGSDWRQLQT